MYRYCEINILFVLYIPALRRIDGKFLHDGMSEIFLLILICFHHHLMLCKPSLLSLYILFAFLINQLFSLFSLINFEQTQYTNVMSRLWNPHCAHEVPSPHITTFPSQPPPVLPSSQTAKPNTLPSPASKPNTLPSHATKSANKPNLPPSMMGKQGRKHWV